MTSVPVGIWYSAIIAVSLLTLFFTFALVRRARRLTKGGK